MCMLFTAKWRQHLCHGDWATGAEVWRVLPLSVSEILDPSVDSNILVLETPDFSNVLSKRGIEKLAEADEYEVVREVQVCRLTVLYYLN